MKVNDYVRTKYGIAKIVNIKQTNFLNLYTNQESVENEYILDKDIMPNYEEDIIKSSPNIIDLIEVGDYVNGVEVIGKIKDLLEFDGGQDGEYFLCEKDIKSIVTKEQFERCEYKI